MVSTQMGQIRATSEPNALSTVGEDKGNPQVEWIPAMESPEPEDCSKTGEESTCGAAEAGTQPSGHEEPEESLLSPSAFSKGPMSASDSADWRNYRVFSPSFSNEMTSVSGSEACEERSSGLKEIESASMQQYRVEMRVF